MLGEYFDICKPFSYDFFCKKKVGIVLDPIKFEENISPLRAANERINMFYEIYVTNTSIADK